MIVYLNYVLTFYCCFFIFFTGQKLFSERVRSEVFCIDLFLFMKNVLQVKRMVAGSSWVCSWTLTGQSPGVWPPYPRLPTYRRPSWPSERPAPGSWTARAACWPVAMSAALAVRRRRSECSWLSRSSNMWPPSPLWNPPTRLLSTTTYLKVRILNTLWEDYSAVLRVCSRFVPPKYAKSYEKKLTEAKVA